MARSVEEIYAITKGPDRINEVVTGKGSYSEKGFKDLSKALVNDRDYKVKTYTNGKEDGEISIHDKWVDSLTKTYKKAGCPQESELGKLDSAELVIDGISETIPFIILEWIEQGKKFDLPETDQLKASIYLAPVEGKTKVVPARNPKTQEELGNVEVTTRDSLKLVSKSPVPNHLKSKKKL